MKIGITIATLLVLFLGSSSVAAQTNVFASQTRACTINSGYTIADAVATARNFAWSDDIAPRVVVFRAKGAVAGNPQFDFLIDSYYDGYADMVERVSAQFQRQAGRNGRRGLDGVATCNDNFRISSVRFAAAADGGPIPPFTAQATAFCELNGATVADAVAMASGLGETLGTANAAVASRSFGGPSTPINGSVQMRLYFPSFPEFGAAWDRLNQTTPTPNPENPISCHSPSLWGAYLIHQRSN